MGCDIHSFAEVRENSRWRMVGPKFPLDDFGQKWEKRTHTEHPFDWRSYGMFGFLANVRNYSHIPVIADPYHSLPPDVSDEVKEEYGEGGDYHTATWLTLRQLKEFNYDQAFWNRRVSKQVGPHQWSGAALAEEGEGEHLTIRQLLGEDFFRDLAILETLGGLDDVRVIFWFDN